MFCLVFFCLFSLVLSVWLPCLALWGHCWGQMEPRTNLQNLFDTHSWDNARTRRGAPSDQTSACVARLEHVQNCLVIGSPQNLAKANQRAEGHPAHGRRPLDAAFFSWSSVVTPMLRRQETQKCQLLATISHRFLLSPVGQQLVQKRTPSFKPLFHSEEGKTPLKS